MSNITFVLFKMNFSVLQPVLRVSSLSLCRFMVHGLGEHLIMQLTWVPWFVAMVIAKGARVL